MKSLKEQAKAFIDKVSDELDLIDTQENKAEIIVEYKNTLNVAQAIITVSNRHKAIEAEQLRQEQAKEQEAAILPTIQAVEEQVIVQVVEQSIETTMSEPITFEKTYKIIGTNYMLGILDQFLSDKKFKFTIMWEEI